MGKNLLKDYDLKGSTGDIIDQVTKTQEQIEKGEKLKDVKFETIVDYYHKRFYEHKEAAAYLKRKGITSPELITRFKIGYSDGSLSDRLSKKQLASLTKINLFTKTGREACASCLIIPLYDATDAIRGLYFLNIKTGTTSLYFLCQKRGIFNHKASRVYDEIILTVNTLDALSLMQTGFDNVQSFENPSNFIDYHFNRLKEDRVKRVILAFPQNQTGEETNTLLKNLFIEENIEVKIITPPEKVVTWQAALKKKITKEAIQEFINAAEVFKPQKSYAGFNVVKDGIKQIFTIDDVRYIIQGASETFVKNLKVNIRVEANDEKFIDNTDLYSARARTGIASTLATLFNMETKKIEKDLITILEHLEQERDRRLNGNDDDAPVELTAEEQMIAKEFLESPDICNQIIDDMTTLGYIAEDLNKLLIYLCATSRLTANPISVLIVSQSASGKSFLIDSVKQLLPPEEVITIHSLSDQALNYIQDLLHKFLAFGEAIFNPEVERQIREMLSSKELSRLIASKDDKTGQIISKIIRKEVNVACVMSTTSRKINPENASRFFMINTDESADQTKRIHEAQKHKYSEDRYYQKKQTIPRILKKHHAAQRLLRKIHIVIPEVMRQALTFPSLNMRTRRDHERFIDLMAVICFLRQYQKELNQFDDGMQYITCDLSDYETAYDIMINGVLTSTLSELPAAAEELYELLRDMTRELGKQKDLKACEVTFTQREARENTGQGQSWIRENLRILVDYEYIERIRGLRRGSRGFYRIKADEPITRLNLDMIPTPDELNKKLQKL